MSLHDYRMSLRLEGVEGVTFRAHIMAAMRRADNDNLARLESLFPEVLAELRARYDAPGGHLPDDGTLIQSFADV